MYTAQHLRFALFFGVFCGAWVSAACGSFEPRPAEQVPDASSAETDTQGVSKSDSGTRNSDGKNDAATKSDSGDTPIESGSASCSAKCQEPAVCKGDKCRCPDGYDDPKGDGSECKDIDECANKSLSKCGRGARCNNKPGGFACECTGPAYTGDGAQCECGEGYTRTDDGLCLALDGRKCEDSLDCQHNACVGGICCAQSCDEPGVCRTDKGATCEDGKTCKYAVTADGEACDDGRACTKDGTCKAGSCTQSTTPTDCNDKNPCTDDSCVEPNGCKNLNNTAACDDANACTSNDACAGGQCRGAATVDCSNATDACGTGMCDPKTGTCVKQAKPGGAVCDDGNTCTLTDTCNAGVCAGVGNACGPNATDCNPGMPNDCMCKDTFVVKNGLCVPTNDECARTNPCSPNATCFDPSQVDGDAMCTCKPGYKGNGVTCDQVDPCTPNPCGDGQCSPNNAGGHTCACPAGTRSLGGTCACDLSGDFGLRQRIDVSWSNIDQIEDGTAFTYSYQNVHMTYDDAGKLTMTLSDCGGTTFDLCDVPVRPLLGPEAYGQYFPVEIWDLPSMSRTTVSFDLPNAKPGTPFNTGIFATLSGLSLTDPLGPFPTKWQDIAGSPSFSGNAVNGAAWLDVDNDGDLGLTTYAVPPGGISRDGVAPEPQRDFGSNSMDCPRNSNGDRYPYAWVPATTGGLSVVRVKRLMGATRSTLAFNGAITSCNQLDGDITGPDDNKLKIEGRVGNCVQVNGNGESGCSSALVDFFDKQPQTQKINSAKFRIKRANKANPTCADLQALPYD
jgi:hypothetical protein